MKNLLAILTMTVSVITSQAQLTMDSTKVLMGKYRLGASTYFQPFLGHAGYGAPWILTRDGGAAAFGDNMLYKFSKAGEEQWMRTVKAQFDEMESQSVAEDANGNLYVFMLSYDSKRYRGGSERVLCYGKEGKLLWDKTLGQYTLMNNPTVSYIRSLDDGRVYMRGHVITEKPVEGKDPVYRYWEGWLNSAGKLDQKAGEQIDWGKEDWQKKFKPESDL